MTKKEIIEEVNRRISDLEKKVEEPEEIEFFRNFNNNYTNISINNIETLQDINPADLFIACYYLNSKQMLKLRKIQTLTNQMNEIFYLDDDFLGNIFSLISYCKDHNKLDILIENLQKGQELKSKTEIIFDLLKNIINDNERKSSTFDSELEAISAVLHELLEKNNIEEKDVLPLLEFARNDIDATMQSISFSSIPVSIRKTIEEMNELIEVARKDPEYKVNEKNIKRYKLGELKEQYKLKNIFEEISNIRKYYEDYERDRIKTQKNNIRSITRYQDFIKQFKIACQKDEIKNYEGLIKNIPDDYLKIEILKLIKKHNSEYHELLTNELNVLKSKGNNNYHILISKYNISKDDYDIEKVMQNSEEDVKEILNILSSKNILEPKLIIYVLENSNLKIVNEIDEYINNTILSVKTVQENIELFNSNSEKYINMKENIELLKEYQVNPKIFNKERNVLLESNEIIKENLNIITKYKLLGYIKNTKDYNFLTLNMLDEKLDSIIELGLIKFIIEDLSLISKINTKYIKLLKDIGYTIDSKDDLLDIINSNPLIDLENIDEYLFNYNQNKTKEINNFDNSNLIEELKVYSIDENTYKVGNILISRNRVLRNSKNIDLSKYEKNEQLFKLLVTDLILSEDEYKEIKNEIYGYQK